MKTPGIIYNVHALGWWVNYKMDNLYFYLKDSSRWKEIFKYTCTFTTSYGMKGEKRFLRGGKKKDDKILTNVWRRNSLIYKHIKFNFVVIHVYNSESYTYHCLFIAQVLSISQVWKLTVSIKFFTLEYQILCFEVKLARCLKMQCACVKSFSKCVASNNLPWNHVTIVKGLGS